MTRLVVIKPRLLMLTLSLLVLLSAAACSFLSNKNFGRFVPDSDVTSAFGRAEANPDFNYYITGSEVYPRSILGLHKTYTLNSELWQEVEFNPLKLGKLVARMQQRTIDCCRQRPFGYVILDDKGKQIGVWYSLMISSISVKVRDDRKVIIYPPNDDEYKIYNDQGR